MIEYIEGEVVDFYDNTVIFNLNGVGIKVIVPSNIEIQKYVKLYTYLIIKDENISLYGFNTKEDREIFKKLLSVNNVGTKVAINILSHFKTEDLVDVIQNGDYKTLSMVHGVGKKTAQKIILELKGKLEFSRNNLYEDLVSALTSYGYDKNLAENIAKKVSNESKTLQEALKKALTLIKEIEK